MSWNDFEKKEILKFAEALGMGFYRVSKEGQFVECDPKARGFFGIPKSEVKLSNYSIADLYAAPAERGMRVDRLIHNKSEPLCSTLYLRIKGENKLLLEICRYDDSYRDEGNFVGFVSGIEESTIFPKMFNTFPMGLFEVDDEDRIVRANKKLVEILKYKNKGDILRRHFYDIFEDREKWEYFNKVINEKGAASDILKLKDAENKIIQVECFSQLINEFGKSRWGMINDVTERERYVRMVEKMATGFYHIEHDENDENHENERLTQCNERFAQILGYKKKEDAIGTNLPAKHHPDKEAQKEFYKALYDADKKGNPLLNYTFINKKINGEYIYISIDVALVRDSKGNVIGREGTIRDITNEIEVREKEKRLNQTTADINKIINAFLHPVIKFAGNSELQLQVSSILQQIVQPGTPSAWEGEEDIKELGETLMKKLIEVRDSLPGIDKNIPYTNEMDTYIKNTEDDLLAAGALKDKLSEIINIYDYNLKSQDSRILLEKAIRDTALWVLEELVKIKFFKENRLKSFIHNDFIVFLQGILFNYLSRSSNILIEEAEMMKREMEALRSYIGTKKKREYTFTKHDLGKILEENVDRFKQVLLEENIEIEYKSSGNLEAEISANDIDRAICNLFHNAKKYSYKGKRRFVKVKAREMQPGNCVEISIQSFGVPIKKEEIENGKIWEFGYRGEFAHAYDRDGVGAGLTDARDVVEAHKGEISITSEPPGKLKENENPGYNVPYLTTVIINLPKTREEKGENNGN